MTVTGASGVAEASKATKYKSLKIRHLQWGLTLVNYMYKL